MTVKERIVTLLSDADGVYRSGEEMAKALGVSRSAVWKAIHGLEKDGVLIETRKKMGYRLAEGTDALTEQTIRPYLHSRVLGSALYVFPELDSTNTYCRKLIRSGAPHGAVVVANHQTAGKGRQNRTFYSPAGSGLYFSVILSQAIPLQDASILTACAAVAAARAIDAVCGTQIQIKWVNDLFLNGKKCCGILTEGEVSLESGKLEHAIIGIGVNIRYTQKYLPKQLCDIATSLEESVPDCRVRRAELLGAILYELERALNELSDRRFLPEYRGRSCLIGKTVEIELENGERRKAVVLGIDDNCRLQIRDTYGNLETLCAGEVHISKI